MNEVEKMYENAGVEKQEPLFCEYFNYSSRDLYERCTRFHEYCADGHFGMKEMCPCGLSKSEREDMFKYPPFTAEKQLQLILFILNTFKQGFNCRVEGGKISLDTLARGIAQEVINHWQESEVIWQEM